MAQTLNRTPRSFALVPAAGRSLRMGQDKLRLEWAGATVIESVLAAWRKSGVDEILVVMREDQTELRALCGGATIVIPDLPPPEMKDSVLAALNHISNHCSPVPGDVWLLAPADMPQLDSSIVKLVVGAHDPNSPAIIVPTSDGKRGHPVLFPWEFASSVPLLAADEGVNALLERFPVREIACNGGEIHGDIDTPEDYHRKRSKHARINHSG